MKKEKGITVIALIITIIVLLILAGIVLTLAMGEESVINRARKAELDHKIGEVKEDLFLYGMATGEWSLETEEYSSLQKVASVEEVKILQNDFTGFKKYDITRIDTLERTIIASIDNPYQGPNQGQNFYIIDMSNLNRNTGIGFKKQGQDDVFILCENTKNVYYAKGINIGVNNKYHGGKQEQGEGNNIVNFPITEPGVYKITANAGTQAIWLSVLLQDLQVPEGATVTLSFQTSDDRKNWSEVVNRIEEAKQSQYIRVTIELVANDKGECPTIQYAKVKFKPVGELEQTVTEEISQEIKEIEEGWVLEPGKSSGIITQTVTMKEPQVIENVYVPIIKDGIVVDEVNTEQTSNGATNTIYVSKDGENWVEFKQGDKEKYQYVKVETTVTEPDITIGKVIVNPKDADVILEKNTWITEKVDYYYFDALQIGTWISIETEEVTPYGTRIKYSFSKSNDDINWTGYSDNIKANGDSRYIMVKVEFQKQNMETTLSAKLLDLLINYTVDGQNKTTSAKETGLKVTAQDIDGGRWQIIATNLSKQITNIEYKKSTETNFKMIVGNRVDITENATYLVKAYYEDGTVSEEVQVVVTGIKALSIQVTSSNEYFTQSNITLTVSASGIGGITELKYAKGEWNTDYFKYNGNSILTNKEIRIVENGIYTIYAKDGEGNEKIVIYGVYNIMPLLEDKGERTTDKGITEYIRDTNIADGKYQIHIKDETYQVEVYNYDIEVKYDRNAYLGDANPDTAMLIIKYNKGLTVKPNVVVTPQTRKKGMYMYVNGTLLNNGEITMTARGAMAEGQNVYLYRNENGEYEYVPAQGAAGGASVNSNTGPSQGGIIGNAGENGTKRSTGGGGSGGTWHWINTGGYSGSGAAGTSYSGGSGGGGCDLRNSSASAQNGSPNGGAGGNASSNYSTGHWAGGGAGNPGGRGSYGGNWNAGYNGSTGTGGLLILYADTILNAGTISSNGSRGGNSKQAGGGSSGGGSINIFYKNNFTIQGTLQSISPRGGNGGEGGMGSITSTSIK